MRDWQSNGGRQTGRKCSGRDDSGSIVENSFEKIFPRKKNSRFVIRVKYVQLVFDQIQNQIILP